MKNRETKLIRETWRVIEYQFSVLDWNNYGKQLLAMTLEESKKHDRFRGESIQRGISIQTEAKYFAIKRLVEYAIDDQKLEAINFVYTQKSCYMAYSMAKNDRFKDVWIVLSTTKKDNLIAMKEIASWDYCDLIATEDRRRGFKASPVNCEVTE